MPAADETDVLVIGAGMGGAAVSKRLSDAGIKVVCLEQGDWVHPSDHPHDYAEWEIEKRRAWSFDPNVRQGIEDYPVTGTVSPYMYNGVGGSTLHYAGAWPRYKPVDFRKGTEHGLEGTIDWPISYEELSPFYDVNDTEMGISGVLGDAAYPPRPGLTRLPTIAPGKLGRKAARGFDALGWHWWPSDNAIATRSIDGRPACNACGNCMSGCPRGSLGSTDATYWPKAVRNGVDLRTNARVERIDAKDGRATGATYVDVRTGSRHEVHASIVVLCANGIGTPRLMLMSAQPGHPDGLANANGLVGTHLMHHSWAFVDCWFDEPIEGFKGAFGMSLYCQQFYDTDTSRGFVNGLTMLVGRSYGSAYTATGTHTGLLAPWGAGHRAFFASHFGRHMAIHMQGEDLPVRANRVTLDTSVVDSSGLPAARVEYEVTENDTRLAAFGIERIVDAAAAMGAIETNHTGVMSPPPGWHLMGTCRMGHGPDDSVTNRYNQTWELPNLLIADGSSLTTGGAVNPTSTIGAIAVRCAEYLKRRGREVASQRSTPSNQDAPAF
jgi:choline dehydrogenase-like flavoprotein